ncbi:hypothetical protein [Humibacter sp. RRB41]|uniref:hypothetical protein n=1 Tax=Humibacter sp. RRB41 TaxID=2919946 RepID=UPI001FA99A02|nr:hypothetical protein [Humibacter sp. RRB41]
MSLALKVHSNVADAATGRVRGKVRKVLEAPQRMTGSEGKFLIEWEHGVKAEVPGEHLIARYSSHSNGWKPF